MRCCGLGSRRWITNSDKLLIYAQIGCSLLGSLSPLYNGVLILHLGLSLFALVAVESSNDSLVRTYAFLLFCSFFLDISWFYLFSLHIWHFPAGVYGSLAAYAVRLTLVVQIAGFSARLLSSLLWVRMCRHGISRADSSAGRDADEDLIDSFINPATPVVRHPIVCPDVDESDPASFLPLYGDRNACRYGPIPNGDASASASETCQLNSSKF